MKFIFKAILWCRCLPTEPKVFIKTTASFGCYFANWIKARFKNEICLIKIINESTKISDRSHATPSKSDLIKMRKMIKIEHENVVKFEGIESWVQTFQ